MFKYSKKLFPVNIFSTDPIDSHLFTRQLMFLVCFELYLIKIIYIYLVLRMYSQRKSDADKQYVVGHEMWIAAPENDVPLELAV